MNSPVEVMTEYNEIVMTWAPIEAWADTGGDNIIYYEVQFFEKPCYENDVDDCAG
jgi:hypothetical protein